jgi:hypothetical protein
MAVRRWFNCSPEQVFAVLHDGWTYPLWVVGASRIRDVDAGWPAPGTTLHHSFGVWPLLIDDTTEVLGIEPGQRLVLEARGWPVGKARVEITVDADTDGSLVTIAEDVIDGPAGSSAGTSGWHRRTQPRDTAPARLPGRRSRVGGTARCKSRVCQRGACRVHAAGAVHGAAWVR